MAGLRDPFRYREEAAHFREQAAAATDSRLLRDSYLALAIEFERLADVLEQGTKAARERAGNAHDKPDPKADDNHTEEEAAGRRDDRNGAEAAPALSTERARLTA